MGTPEVGVPSLLKLIEDENFDVVGVFTNPDRPVGRKQVLTAPPVKVVAKEHGIPVFQPEKFREEANKQLRELIPDVAVVIAYGQILRQETLDIPKHGILNIHYSLLPKYRGAVPVQAAVINGDKETGITIQKMVLGLDEGGILSQEKTAIGENETSGELLDRLSQDCAGQLIRTLKLYLNGKITPREQNHSEATLCQQSDIAKDKARINWEKSAEEIHNLVRGMNPWPVAWTMSDGKRVKIFGTKLAQKCKIVPEKPGTIFSENGGMYVVCSHGILEVFEIQVEGKSKVSGGEFVQGFGEKAFE